MQRQMHAIAGILGMTALSLSCGSEARMDASKAQQSKTKIESFQEQVGVVLVKGRTELGSVSHLGSVTVVSMELIEPSTQKKALGVALEIRDGRQTRTAVIDYDEIDSLVEGIHTIEGITPAASSLEETEVMYLTRSGLIVMVFHGKSGGPEALVALGSISQTCAFLTMEQLSELRQLIAKAKQALDQIASGTT